MSNSDIAPTFRAFVPFTVLRLDGSIVLPELQLDNDEYKTLLAMSFRSFAEDVDIFELDKKDILRKTFTSAERFRGGFPHAYFGFNFDSETNHEHVIEKALPHFQKAVIVAVIYTLYRTFHNSDIDGYFKLVLCPPILVGKGSDHCAVVTSIPRTEYVFDIRKIIANYPNVQEAYALCPDAIIADTTIEIGEELVKARKRISELGVRETMHFEQTRNSQKRNDSVDHRREEDELRELVDKLTKELEVCRAENEKLENSLGSSALLGFLDQEMQMFGKQVSITGLRYLSDGTIVYDRFSVS